MCSCTARRISVIAACAAMPRTCDSMYDVTACTTVAAPVTSAIGISSSVRPLVSTSSIRYFDEAGSTRPLRRLISITASPSASRPRRAQTRALASSHASDQRIFFFASLPSLPPAASSARACVADDRSPASFPGIAVLVRSFLATTRSIALFFPRDPPW